MIRICEFCLYFSKTEMRWKKKRHIDKFKHFKSDIEKINSDEIGKLDYFSF